MVKHPLTQLWETVRQFQLAFGQPAPDEPTLQTTAQATRRSDWIKEEADELLEARTIMDQADAYIDAIYFGVGGLVELGVDPGPLWDIVHNANMSKLWKDGTVHRREDGKVIKPPHWVDPGPLLQAEINRQLNK
jgi:predicted HAD superfamily Cof-like phosphohydrolase